MERRRYRGEKINNVTGFDHHEVTVVLPLWEGKDEFLEKLVFIQNHLAKKINYGNMFENNDQSEYSYKGWRWPVRLESLIRNINYDPGPTFKDMIEGEQDYGPRND